MKTAVIDIGSNTIKLDIFNVLKNDAVQLSARSEKGALAKHTKSGALSDEGYEILKNILEKYIIISTVEECEKIYIFATQSLRGISNAAEVCKNIKDSLGVTIEIISGDEEAMYSLNGLMLDCPSADCGIMADMGGGSLELVNFKNKLPTSTCSLPLGALRVKELLGIDNVPTAEDEAKIKEYITDILKKAPTKNEDTVYLIGGTARSVFSLCFDGKTEVARDDMKTAYRSLCQNKNETLTLLFEKLPKRADNFMTGFYIFNILCEYYNIKKIVLCKKGVRDGYLMQKTENGNI